MTEYTISGHQVLISPDGRIWVNSGITGAVIARFNPRNGGMIDIHGEDTCLDCGKGTLGEFVLSLNKHHKIDIGSIRHGRVPQDTDSLASRP